MKKVLTFGTFDIFHKGHEFYLKQAKKHGDLFVVIARDSTVKKIKGKLPKNNQLSRLKNIQRLRYVHKAVLGNPGDKYKIIEELKPDIICLGYDQTSFTENLQKELKQRNLNVKIIRIKGYETDKYKSSKLRDLK